MCVLSGIWCPVNCCHTPKQNPVQGVTGPATCEQLITHGRLRETSHNKLMSSIQSNHLTTTMTLRSYNKPSYPIIYNFDLDCKPLVEPHGLFN